MWGMTGRMYIAYSRRGYSFAVLLLSVWVCACSFGLTIRSADDELSNFGLPLDPEVIAGYLEAGIPADHIRPGQKNYVLPGWRLGRWEHYRWMAEYLGESGYVDAIPILLAVVYDELPLVLRHDLDVHVVGVWPHETHGDMDAASVAEIDRLKWACAQAAVRLNGNRPLFELQNYSRTRLGKTPVLTQHASARPEPNPQSLRERVSVADQSRRWTVGFHQPSVKWLEANGSRHVRGFRRIATDRFEEPRVRREALRWYTKFGGTKSHGLIRRYARGDIPNAHAEDVRGVQTSAIRLLNEYSVEGADETAQAIILDGGPAASHALNSLARNPRNYPFLAEHFETVSSDLKQTIVQKFAYADELVSTDIFARALQGDDMILAIYGYRGVQKFNLVERLDEEAQAAYERWVSDPQFLVAVLPNDIREDDRLATCRTILDLIDGTDARAARMYRDLYTALYRLPRLISDEAAAQRMADEAWLGFMRCVDAYRASRGL